MCREFPGREPGHNSVLLYTAGNSAHHSEKDVTSLLKRKDHALISLAADGLVRVRPEWLQASDSFYQPNEGQPLPEKVD